MLFFFGLYSRPLVATANLTARTLETTSSHCYHMCVWKIGGGIFWSGVAGVQTPDLKHQKRMLYPLHYTPPGKWQYKFPSIEHTYSISRRRCKSDIFFLCFHSMQRWHLHNHWPFLLDKSGRDLSPSSVPHTFVYVRNKLACYHILSSLKAGSTGSERPDFRCFKGLNKF